MKKIFWISILLTGRFSFGLTASQFYVFGEGTQTVAFCKEPPPKLFEFKKIGDDKIRAAEVVVKQVPYDEGWIFMDFDNLALGNAKPPKTCWTIETSTQDFPILVKGIKAGETYPYFKSLTLKVKPGTKTEIKSGSASYNLEFPPFDPTNADGTVAGMRPKNLTVKAQNWSCTLTSIPYLDDKETVDVLLAADFNADSRPDFILDAASKGRAYQLNLSRSQSHDCESKPTNQEKGGC
jgi:hypothetical protein